MLPPRLLVWLRYCCLLSALLATSANGADAHFTPEQERILQLSTGKYVIEEPLLCYQVGETLLVPLGQLAQLIDLAVTTTPATGHAEGFVFRESQTFLLDVGQKIAVVSGVTHPLNPARLRVALDDIYVDAALLKEWFPFALEPNLLNSQLVIRSSIPLPFEERMQRESRAGRLVAHPTSRLPTYPRRDEPYRMWEPPFIDQTLRLGVARDAEGKRSSNYTYTTYGSGDLLKMESSWYLAGSQHGEDTFRMTLSRKDPDGRVLGPMGLTELSFGHVLEPRVNLINMPGLSEPGILFGNAPLYRSSTYDTHTFVGDLQPGWEVELYHNNVLLGYQRPNSEGQYRFDNIPLIYGSNYFRLVFYGPQGQRLEETQQFEIGPSQLPAGEQFYRLMAVQDKQGENRTIIDYQAGLLSNLSFSGNLVSLPLSEADGTVRQHDYLRAGLHTSLYKAVISLGVIDDTQSGSAVDWRIQGRVDGTVIGLNLTLFNDFVSEEFTASQLRIMSRSQLRLDSMIPTTRWTPMLPLSLELGRDQYQNDVENRRGNLRLSMQNYGYSLSNMLSWSKFGHASHTTTGALQAAMHSNNVVVRADYQYTLAPDVGTSSITLGGDLVNFYKYNFNAGITHTVASHRTYLSAGANRDYGSFLGLVSLRYGDEGDYFIEAGVNFGLGRNPRNGNWTMRSQGLARYGAVAPRAFLDENGNGRHDPDEQPLADVGFQFNGVRRPQLTNPQGDAFITGAFPYQPTGVNIDSGTLGDPGYSPTMAGVTLVNRPGHVTMLDFPVTMTGEVDGTVSLLKEGRSIAVGGVELQLVAADGRIIQQTKTAFDGFYLFTKVPPGAYEVRIDPEQTKRLGLIPPEPRAAAIRGPEWFSSGVDFRLEIAETSGSRP